MRTLVFLVILLLTAACSPDLPPQTVQGSVGNKTGLSFELPGKWSGHQADNQWKSGDGDVIKVLAVREDPLAANVRTLATALELLQSPGQGPAAASAYLYQESYNPVIADTEEREAMDKLWLEVEKARELLGQKKPDKKTARAKLVKVKTAFEKANANFEARARRYPFRYGYSYGTGLGLEKLTPCTVAGKPAFMLDCRKASNNEPMRVLYFDADGRDAAIVLYGDEDIDPATLDRVAASMKIGGPLVRPIPNEPDEDPRAERERWKRNKEVGLVAFLLLAGSLPGAVGAWISCSESKFLPSPSSRAVFWGAFWPSAICTLVVCVGLCIWIFAEMSGKGSSSSANLMAFIAVAMFIAIFAVGSLAVAAVNATLSGIGASLGARLGAFTSALLAALLSAAGLWAILHRLH